MTWNQISYSLHKILAPPGTGNPDENHSLDTMMVNFGPQHPAAHGVLRLILEMAAEVY